MPGIGYFFNEEGNSESFIGRPQLSSRIKAGVRTTKKIDYNFQCTAISNHDAYLEKYLRGEFNLYEERVGLLIEMVDKGTHFEAVKVGEQRR